MPIRIPKRIAKTISTVKTIQAVWSLFEKSGALFSSWFESSVAYQILQPMIAVSIISIILEVVPII
jgi:hypothetical protein